MENICIFVRSKICIEQCDCWTVTIHGAGIEGLPSLVNGQIVDNISKKNNIKFTSTMAAFLFCTWAILQSDNEKQFPYSWACQDCTSSRFVLQACGTITTYFHKIFKSTLMSPSSEPVKRTSPAKTAHSMSSECLSQSAATAEIWSRCVWFSDPFYLACF